MTSSLQNRIEELTAGHFNQSLTLCGRCVDLLTLIVLDAFQARDALGRPWERPSRQARKCPRWHDVPLRPRRQRIRPSTPTVVYTGSYE